MPNSLSAIARQATPPGLLARGQQIPKAPGGLRPGAAALEERFQEFVAGTFYNQMLKALREGQKPPRYLHGGQAEEIFQSHLDQGISELMARQHGAHLAAPLYAQFARQPGTASAQQDPAHALDAAV
jgi:Rod binding domain-containing protein